MNNEELKNSSLTPYGGKIKGVVFDMDGLMIDTERLTYKLYKSVMADMGYDLTLDIFKRTIGLRSADTKLLYKQLFGENLDFDSIKASVLKNFREHTENNGVPIKDGLFELLDYLKSNGIKAAVATSTSGQTAGRLLSLAGIAPYMTAFVFGDMIANGKPAPDIFLKACELLGEQPQFCIGLEDSYNGLKAVHSANMIPVMVPDMLEPTPETEKLIYKKVKNLSEVIDIIKAM